MLFVQVVLWKADKDKSSDISFSEFVEYMREHERKLRLAFSDLDRNKDGKAALRLCCILILQQWNSRSVM